MRVEEILALDKRKYKIILEGQESIALYRKEMLHYELEEGKDLPDEIYQTILNEVLMKRARERALYLLKDMDRTEKQIVEKLRRGYYPKCCIEAAIAYLKEYHYIDDEAYAERFIEAKKGNMSRRQIEYKLMEKGISEEIRKKYMDGMEGEEEAALEKLLRKKCADYSAISREERQKIYQYFMRKGFAYDIISKKITEIESTNT